MTYVASDAFAPSDPFELVSYTRALAALMPWLDSDIANAARQNIEAAINEIAEQEKLSDQDLWALPETVEVGARLVPPLAIQPARDRLHEVIGAAAPAADAGWRGHAISRSIQIMGPDLTDAERRHAVGYLLPLLGQNPDLWSAKAVPRTLAALLPTLEPDQASATLSAVPEAIAAVAASNADSDSSYLLALMQVAETLADTGDQTAIAAFGQALTRQLSLPMDAVQRAALARATVPLLQRQGEGLPILVRTVAAATLPNQRTPQQAENTLRQALPGSEGPPQRAQPALDLLHADWTAKPAANASPNPYRRAAQARLVAMLAPSLTPELTGRAAEDLLSLLPDTSDHLSREAIARALTALAPELADAGREQALAAAQIALAKTGSTEEATAWAGAIAALLPDERAAATAAIVEALKYPTATEAPSVQLLNALAPVWGAEHAAIEGMTLPNDAVLNWLETRLPKGQSLTEPPEAPPDLQSEPAVPGPG
jgi:hypothetical protein